MGLYLTENWVENHSHWSTKLSSCLPFFPNPTFQYRNGFVLHLPVPRGRGFKRTSQAYPPQSRPTLRYLLPHIIGSSRDIHTLTHTTPGFSNGTQIPILQWFHDPYPVLRQPRVIRLCNYRQDKAAIPGRPGRWTSRHRELYPHITNESMHRDWIHCHPASVPANPCGN